MKLIEIADKVNQTIEIEDLEKTARRETTLTNPNTSIDHTTSTLRTVDIDDKNLAAFKGQNT